MKSSVLERANAYIGLNAIALKGEIVVYGSSYMANFPFYELINRCHLENAVYNRSIDGMTSDEAEELLEQCVIQLAPKKIFLQLGEADSSADDVIRYNQMILRTIRTKLPESKVYLLGQSSGNRNERRINEALKMFCDNIHVFFIPFMDPVQDLREQYFGYFKQLVMYFRDHPIGFSDAFVMSQM